MGVGCLAGVEVLDFTNLLPGPFCTLELVRKGARVLKVEHVSGGDPLRSLPPRSGSDNAFFIMMNRGKESIQVDLKADRGREIALGLIRRADVLVESFRPGAMARLGLDFDKALAINPRLVYASLSAFGSADPRPAHDLNFLAIAGLLGLHQAEGVLRPPPLQLGDMLGGLDAASRIGFGLFQRERTGRGCFLDVCMTDSVFNVVAHVVQEFLAARRKGEGFGPIRPLTGLYPCYNLYPTGDGRWAALGALEPQFWRAFCDYFEAPELCPLQFDPSPKARDLVASIFRAKTLADIEKISAATSFCLTPVYEMETLLRSDFLRARLHGVGAEGNVDGGIPGPPGEDLGPVPDLGQHTDQVLLELGYSRTAIEDMRNAGVVAGPAGSV